MFIKILPGTKNDLLNLQDMLEEKIKTEALCLKEDLGKPQEINKKQILEKIEELKEENNFLREQIKKINEDYNEKIFKLNEEIHNMVNLMNKVMLAELVKNHKDSLNKILAEK